MKVEKRFINHEGRKQKIINPRGWKNIYRSRRLKKVSSTQKVGNKGLSTLRIGKMASSHEGWKQKGSSTIDGKIASVLFFSL